MEEIKSHQMARYFATSSIKWDPKPAHDTVNESVFKLLFSMEKNKEIDILSEFMYIPELRHLTEEWMIQLFGRKIPLYSCFLQKYSEESNISGKKVGGSLVVHVDGSSDTDDLCAVVYTLHYGA
jgi:hypothetical protein